MSGGFMGGALKLKGKALPDGVKKKKKKTPAPAALQVVA